MSMCVCIRAININGCSQPEKSDNQTKNTPLIEVLAGRRDDLGEGGESNQTSRSNYQFAHTARNRETH